jgi:hypothetical protein
LEEAIMADFPNNIPLSQITRRNAVGLLVSEAAVTTVAAVPAVADPGNSDDAE